MGFSQKFYEITFKFFIWKSYNKKHFPNHCINKNLIIF